MRSDFQHIQNVYISVAQRSAYEKINTLIIETDIDMPKSGDIYSHMKMDSLLLELNTLKERCPAMFEAVDYVEIRKNDRINSCSDDFIYMQPSAMPAQTRH